MITEGTEDPSPIEESTSGLAQMSVEAEEELGDADGGEELTQGRCFIQNIQQCLWQ